ncbi:MAG: sigma-70 family RNA polymerase sigma factor [Saprospiraceae bacterium]
MSLNADEEILRLLQSGIHTELGFRMLMDKYQERLYFLIRRMVIDHDDANDVLQNVFIKVFRNIKNFESRAGLYTWLFRIASNESLTFIKKRKSNQVNLTESMTQWLDQRMAAPDEFDGDEIERKLITAMESLPERQKLVFQLRYYDEMPYEEMSKKLQTTEGSLKASYHHAVKKIESYFKREE